MSLKATLSDLFTLVIFDLIMNLNSQLISKLASLHDTQFTGIVTITTKNAQAWNIYFYLGQLLWTESNIHRNRFWQRNLSKLCPQVTTTEHKFENINNAHTSDYYLINTLRENKLVTREKIGSPVLMVISLSYLNK